MDQDAKKTLMEHLNKHKENIEKALTFFKEISQADKNWKKSFHKIKTI